jgi:hypothetical protein
MTDDPITLPSLSEPPVWTTDENGNNNPPDLETWAEDYASAAVLADRAEREKDAMRYRWLRDRLCTPGPLPGVISLAIQRSDPEQVDVLIDAAIQEGK